jgi:hypothetical protein
MRINSDRSHWVKVFDGAKLLDYGMTIGTVG